MIQNIIPIIDGGHGFNTLGKESPDGSLKENEYNDAIVNKVTYGLYKLGIDYRLTASRWDDVPLRERVQLEWDLIDQGYRTIFISIHADAYTDPKVGGNKVFHYLKAGKESKVAAKYFSDAINSFNNPIINKGVHSADFYVLRETKGTAILIESGFMTNANDLKALKTEDFRNAFAESLVKAIANYTYNNVKLIG